MSTPHNRIHRLAAVGGAVIALAAALPAAASARVQPDPNQPVAPPAVTAVEPNPDNRPAGSGHVLPHTNWVTPDGVGGSVGPQAYYYATNPTPAPHAKASGGSDVLAPAGFAGVVLLVGLSSVAVRRRRGAKVAA